MIIETRVAQNATLMRKPKIFAENQDTSLVFDLLTYKDLRVSRFACNRVVKNALRPGNSEISRPTRPCAIYVTYQCILCTIVVD